MAFGFALQAVISNRRVRNLAMLINLLLLLLFNQACSSYFAPSPEAVDPSPREIVCLEQAQSEDKAVSARGYECLVHLAVQQRDNFKAQDYSLDASLAYSRAGDMKKAGDMQLVYADFARDSGSWGFLPSYYEDARDYYEKTDSPRLYPLELREAVRLLKRGRLDEARTLIETARKHAAEWGDDRLLFQSHALYGVLELRIGHPGTAMTALVRVLHGAELLHFEELKAEVLDNLALVSLYCDDVDAAEKYARLALETEKELGRVHGIGQVMLTRSMIAMRKGDLEQAEVLADAAYRHIMADNVMAGGEEAAGTLASVYMRQHRWKTARELLENAWECYRYSDQNYFIPEISTTLANLGYVHLKLGDTDKALRFGNYSVARFEESKMWDPIFDTEQWLAPLRREVGTRDGQDIAETSPAFTPIPFKYYRLPDLRHLRDAMSVLPQNEEG